MVLTKYKLGDLMHLYSCKCGVPDLTPYQVSGVNKDKEFFEPSHQKGEDTSKYQIVPRRHFACNLMHVGRDRVLPIAYNHSDYEKIVSPAYTVFSLKESCGVLDDYFFIMLKCEEHDRYFWFHADASVRDGMSWSDFCDVEIIVPDIPTQQKYVDIYNAMVANQQAYERGLEDLKIVFTGYIEDLRRKGSLHKIGDYITPFNEKNRDELITLEQGININKEFITPQRSNSNLQGRKIVRHGQFAYCTQLNNANVAIAYRSGEDCVVSSVYDVFEITRKEELIPEYLLVWLIRPEFGRYVYWASEGSAYEFLNYNNLGNYKIPVPNINIQKAIAEMYTVYIERKRINEQLKTQIKDICPILIKGALEQCYIPNDMA